MLQAVEIESNSQLQCVKCPQALNHSVLNQEFPRALKMAFVNRRRNNQALARKIGPEAASGNLQCSLINLPSPDFHGKNGFELYNRKAGNQRSRDPLFQNTIDIIRAGLLMVQFRQSAGIKKIVRPSQASVAGSAGRWHPP